jgi:hemolysin activation/secretion protein
VGAGIISTLLLTSPALAQTQPTARERSITDPGRVEGQLDQRRDRAEAKPRIDVKEYKIDQPPEGADNVTFTLRKVSITGNTVYNAGELRDIYTRQLGEDITLADLYGIAADITRKYRNAGYVLTQALVPPQSIGEGGEAEIRIVEGFVENIEIEGKDDNGLGLVRKYVEAIAEKKPLNVKDLERALLLVNDLPGVSARSILSPSPQTTGAADLRVIVERDFHQHSLSIDNYGSRFLGPVQLTGATNFNSTMGNNERIGLQAVIAPDSDLELGYIGANYNQPIGPGGTQLRARASYTETNPGFTLEQFDVEGESVYGEIGIMHPLVRRREFNIDLRAQFDARNTENTTNIPTRSEDDIRMLRAGGALEFVDTLFNVGVNTIDLEIAKGLDILGASEEGDTNLTRTNADPQAWKANATLERLQRLTGSVNLLLHARGQLASHALLSSEEFGVGGSTLGRGFDNSEIIGDDGFAGKAELRWREPVNINQLDTYEVFTFFDAGRVYNDNPNTADFERDTLTSTGFGARAQLWDETASASLTVGFPLNRQPETQDDEGPRVFFSLSKTF